MTDEMLPPLAARVAELDRYVAARDIGWFRQQHTAGSLAWLETHLGPTEYSALGAAIEDGDIDLVGRRLAVMDVVTPVVEQPLSAVPVIEPVVGREPLSGRVFGDPLSSDLDDPTLIVSRHGAVLPAAAVRRERNTLVVTAIVLTLIAIGVVAYLLLRNSDEQASDTSIVDTSIVTETIVAETVVAETVVPSEPLASSPTPPTSIAITMPVAPTTIPPNGAATVSVTASLSKAAVPAPVVTVPLVDAVTTAGRSATFGPYLSMVDAAGLTNELRELKNVTFLAPTESAFAALPTEVQVALRSPSNRDVLARIVRYGVLTQSRSAAQLTPGNYTTAEGSPVNVQLLDGTIRINDATITGQDVKVVNGVLHAVDRLLVPGTIDLNALVPKSAPPATAAPVRVSTAPTTPVTPAPTAAPVTPTTVAATSPATTSPPATSAPATAAPTVAPTTRAPTTTVA